MTPESMMKCVYCGRDIQSSDGQCHHWDCKKLTDNQIKNWRDLLSKTAIGPLARTMSKEQILAIRDFMQDIGDSL